MKEIICQLRQGCLTPNSPEDLELLSEYKENQLVRCKTYSVGAKKERSVTQLGLLYACIKLASENIEDDRFNTPAKMKFACKVYTHFIQPDVCFIKPDGTIVYQYRSFAFSELEHMEATNIFEECFNYMADLLGVTKEKLIAEAQERMGRNG